MTLLTLVALPFVAALAIACAHGAPRAVHSAIAGGASALGLVLIATLAGTALSGPTPAVTFPWVPALGLDLSLMIDPLGWMFALLILGIGLLVIIFAHFYLYPTEDTARFFASLMLFQGAMLGIVIAGNVLLLLVFWEMTSLASFLLIGFWQHKPEARAGARMALAVTGGGGLALIGGIVLLGIAAGSFDLATILTRGDIVKASPLYPAILGLILLGCFTKSAQFPFHFWLPHAMAAPTPVSAYLHSATMVKAGVFLLARLWPVLAGTDEWFWLVTGAGLATLLVGGFAAIFQNDLKGLLAYSTISHLGLITTLLGLNSPLAAVAAVFHIINHATFKASLFMAVGVIDHETGTRDIRRLSGLARYMPITATLATVAAAAMAGVPLLNGFISKEMFFSEAVFLAASPGIDRALPVVAVVAGMFSVAYSLRFTVEVFLGRDKCGALPRQPHEPPRWMRAPISVLVLACLVVGTLPQWSIQRILETAARPVVGTLPAFDLAVWHGFNLPLWMSLLSLVGGIALFFALRSPMRRGHIAKAPLIGRINGKRVFRSLLARLTLAGRHTRRLFGTRRLQMQLMLLVLVTLVAAAVPLRKLGSEALLAGGDRAMLEFSPMFALMWLVGAGAAIGAVWQAKYHRLTALALMSVSGLVTVITFAWFSAPDLALTQLSVEAVTTVLIMLGLRWLPKRLEDVGRNQSLLVRARARVRRARDLTIALAAGAGLALLSWAMMTRSFPQSISPFFLERALPEGGGSNVVNVMLVDFRGFDTLGEITVLGVVALTVYALLRRFRPAPESAELPAQQRALPADLATDLVDAQTAEDTARGYLMVPAVLVRLVLPLAAVIAVYLFMRGHNEPGGGFVAGLVLSTAFIVQYIVSGTQWVEAHMDLRPQRWIAFGLLTATATGLGSFALGYPFLTTHTAHLSLPLIGDIHVASALFYDIGVFLLVVGATLLILTALGHQSVRGRRVRDSDDDGDGDRGGDQQREGAH